jgi:hypothetical protein
MVYTIMKNMQYILNVRNYQRSWAAFLEPQSVDVYDEDLYDDQELYEVDSEEDELY